MPATTGQVYLGNTLISSVQVNDGWTRPTEWLPLPTATPASVKILHAVFDQDENYAAMRMVVVGGATYQVDWGDGVVDIVASNTLVQHNYSFSNPVLAGTLTSQGYKQAIISVTPTTGTFSQCFLNPKSTTPAGLQNYATGFLDINLNLPNLIAGTTLQIGGAVRHGNLERVNITSWGAVTNLINLFNGCAKLQSCNETEWDMSAIVNIQNLFSGASSIKSLDCTNWNLSNCPNLQSAFNNCNSLGSIVFGSSTFPAATNMSGIFSNCTSLQAIDLSMWDVSNVTAINSAFNRCSALRDVNLNGWNTLAVTDANNMFINCNSLQKIPPLNLTNVTPSANMASFASGCTSLVRMQASNIKVSFSVANCLLGSAALNEIYNNLATVAGQTITVTGNYGTTGDNPSIATAKGWTVTG